MEKINAVITGVGGYVPDYILTNDEISKMVDTTDEWIMGRIGIKERRILKEEGLGTSYIARKAVKQLIKRTQTNPDDIDLIIVATTTPDYRFPSTASILCERLGLKRAFAFDMQAVCSGFLYALETGANFIRSGNYKKVVVVGAEKMSSIINYTDRATCPIFGDGGAAVMLEPTTEDFGIMDAVLRTDGKGLPFLHIKAGGSICTPSYYTLDNQMHYIYQEGRTVFKYAVSNMADACESIIARNHLSKENIDWVIPHQANQRIITAVTQRLEVPVEKYFIFRQVLNITFENHFIGDIIRISVAFIKDYGISLTKIREECVSMKPFTSSSKSKAGSIFIGGMVLLYFQIINDFSGLTFLGQCREPQRSCPCTSLIIHVTGF